MSSLKPMSGIALVDGLDSAVLDQLAFDATQYCLAHGLALGGDAVPVSLFPSPMPRDLFKHAYQLTPTFQRVLGAAANDIGFLSEALAPCSNDPLVGPLLKLAQTSHRSGTPSLGALTITRNDYMMNMPTNSLQQIEINTIACAFPALSPRVATLHRFVLQRAGLDELISSLPRNDSFHNIPAALAQAHRLYGKDDAVIVFVVHAGEKNITDQWWLEYALFHEYGIRVLRRSLTDIGSRAERRPDQSLVIDGKEAAVFYFRTGYAPQSYPTEVEWEGRRRIEFSRAISCPNVTWHLLTTKKIQQVLAAPGVLDRLATPADAADVRAVFTGLWAGEDPTANALALADPAHFVLKPQREGGGGNNLYGEAVAQALRTMSPAEKAEHVLMRLVEPPRVRGVLVAKGERVTGDVVGELGIYGTYFTHRGAVLCNEASGHLIRSKLADKLDGGVAAGVAVLDSPLLVPTTWW